MTNKATWLAETFPPKEFLLRSSTGIRHYKLASSLQVLLIALILSSVFALGFVAYRMHMLSSINMEQSRALVLLQQRYKDFSSDIFNLRQRLESQAGDLQNNSNDSSKNLLQALALLEHRADDLASESSFLLESKLSVLRKKLNRVSVENTEVWDIVKESKVIIDSLKEKLGSTITSLNMESIVRKKLTDKLENIESERDELNQKNIKLSKDLDSSRDEISVLASSAEISSKRSTSNELKALRLENQIRIEKEQSDRIVKNNKSLNESITAALIARDQANIELKSLKNSINKMEKNIITLTDERLGLRKTLTNLVEKRINEIEEIMKDAKIEWLADVDQELLIDSSDKFFVSSNSDLMATGVGGPFIAADLSSSPSQKLSRDLIKLEILHERLSSVPLVAPLDHFYISSKFGYRKDPVNGRRAFHGGIDLGGAWQSIIYAPAKGKVTFAGRYGSYGITVFVDHGFGIETRYGHLSKAFVKRGDQIDYRTKLGKVGRTGRAKGEHLHYEIRIADKTVNPLPFMEAVKNVFK